MRSLRIGNFEIPWLFVASCGILTAAVAFKFSGGSDAEVARPAVAATPTAADAESNAAEVSKPPSSHIQPERVVNENERSPAGEFSESPHNEAAAKTPLALRHTRFVVETKDEKGNRVVQEVRRQEGEEIPDGFASTYYPNGQLRSAGMHVDGERHGAWTFFDRDGNLLASEQFDRGTLHGPFTLYHPNGLPKESGTMVEGQKHGRWFEWKTSGARSWVMHYEHDDLCLAKRIAHA